MNNGASSCRRFLNGDTSGFVELVREYKDGLILYLSSFTGMQSDGLPFWWSLHFGNCIFAIILYNGNMRGALPWLPEKARWILHFFNAQT